MAKKINSLKTEVKKNYRKFEIWVSFKRFPTTDTSQEKDYLGKKKFFLMYVTQWEVLTSEFFSNMSICQILVCKVVLTSPPFKEILWKMHSWWNGNNFQSRCAKYVSILSVWRPFLEAALQVWQNTDLQQTAPLLWPRPHHWGNLPMNQLIPLKKGRKYFKRWTCLTSDPHRCITKTEMRNMEQNSNTS